jgi:hypothetical protein
MTSRFRRSLLLLPVVFLGITAPASLSGEVSRLWGERGEKWDAAGRLPDFSYAGYSFGEKPLPDLPVVANVKDFGAIGDGVADDTAAFKAAIQATARGAIFVPPGRYVITDFVYIAKSGLVLRGAGPRESILVFPRGLDEIHPRARTNSTGRPTSGYSFSGAFITIDGELKLPGAVPILATARRGDRTVQVASTDGFAVGQRVMVVLQETPEHSLKTYLYNGDPGDIAKAKQLETRMVLRITALAGAQVTFDRPLRFETRPEWKPMLRRFEPTVEGSGVEKLGFEFPDMRYRGHFMENGANALELRKVHDCWVRDVHIHNADMGITVMGTHNTLTDILVTASPNRPITEGKSAGASGHHGIQCRAAQDNLITRFDFQTIFLHDLSVENAAGNVYSQGRGQALAFDHHKDTPYENLFSDIDVGTGQRIWISGGGPSLGRETAGWATFWNIRSSAPFALPKVGWGPATMNFIGLNAETVSAEQLAQGIHWEPIPPEKISPRDIHAAQRERRLRTCLAKSLPASEWARRGLAVCFGRKR